MNLTKSFREIVAITGCSLSLTASASGGQLKITGPAAGDTPPAGGTPPANLYVAISKYMAANSGVNFGATETTQNGTVTAWLWNFTNGNPSSSDQQSPGVVTFSDSAYGCTNACTVNLAHTSTDPNGRTVLCTKLLDLPVATVNVNVVEPNLFFKTDGYSTDNESATRFVSNYGQPNFGQKTEFVYNGKTRVGCAYEYDFTIEGPSQSGASPTDMSIFEQPVRTLVYSDGPTEVSRHSFPTTSNIYNPGGYYSYIPSSPVPLSTNNPDNPIMYASDMPAYGLASTQDYMAAYSCNTFTGTIVLTSTPLFQDPSGVHKNTAPSVSHTFTITCVSDAADGSGPYHWSATY